MSPKAQRIIGWVLSGLLGAFLIVGSGVPKFLPPNDDMQKILDTIGWSAEKIKVIGVIEVVITLLFLIPRTGFLGSILLTGYLGGAAATHARLGDFPAFPVVIGVLVWVAYALRNPVILRLVVGATPTSPSAAT